MFFLFDTGVDSQASVCGQCDFSFIALSLLYYAFARFVDLLESWYQINHTTTIHRFLDNASFVTKKIRKEKTRPSIFWHKEVGAGPCSDYN